MFDVYFFAVLGNTKDAFCYNCISNVNQFKIFVKYGCQYLFTTASHTFT